MNRLIGKVKHNMAVTLRHYLCLRLGFRAVTLANLFIDQPKALPAPCQGCNC